MWSRLTRFYLLVFLLTPLSASAVVTIDWVTVHDPGNACETQSQGCFGAVSYDYRIGKFEVTNSQYTEFLNAVAATDTNALYSENNGSGFGGITRSGISGSFSYSAIAGREDMPTNLVSFYDALRFANWLHNGQPIGAQTNATTEDGAYTITAAGITDNSITRNVGAEFFLTSEDEWYKAAYYDRGTMSYFAYPAASDTQTTCTTPGATANTANCFNVVADLVAVGSYTGAASPNGTFDQGGNAFELNEGISGFFGEDRVQRGGNWDNNPFPLAAVSRSSFNPIAESSQTGFRIAAPIAPMLLLVGAANGQFVEAFDGATGAALGDFTSGAPTMSGPSALAIGGPLQNLFVAPWSLANRVDEFDRATGEFVRSFQGVFSNNTAKRMEFGPDGHLYVTAFPDGISRWDVTTGTLIGSFVALGSGGLQTSIGGMRFGPDGHLYVVSKIDLRAFNIDFGTAYGVPATNYGAASDQVGGWNLAGLGSTSLVYASGFASGASVNVIAGFAGSNGGIPSNDDELLLHDYFLISGGNSWSVDLGGMADGDYLVFLYAPNNSPTGDMTVGGIPVPSIPGNAGSTLIEGTSWISVQVTVAGGTLAISGTDPSFSGLAGLQIVPLVPAELGVLRFEGSTGAPIDIFVTPGSGGLTNARDLTFGPSGDLYVTDAVALNVLRYDGTTGNFVEVFTSGIVLRSPWGLTFGPDENLYVTWYTSGSPLVIRFDGLTGALIGTFAVSTNEVPTFILFAEVVPAPPSPSVPSLTPIAIALLGSLAGLAGYRRLRA